MPLLYAAGADGNHGHVISPANGQVCTIMTAAKKLCAVLMATCQLLLMAVMGTSCRSTLCNIRTVQSAVTVLSVSVHHAQ